MTVELDDVRIRKAEVEIKIIRVGNKQMTQSVFKQLDKKPPYEFMPEFNIEGQLLGRVNYKCGDDQGDGVQIIWTDEKQIYRYFVKDMTRENFLEYLLKLIKDEYWIYLQFGNVDKFYGRTDDIDFLLEKFIKNLTERKWRENRYNESMNAIKEEHLYIHSSDDELHLPLEDFILDCQRKFFEWYFSLEELGQLFIAV